MKDEFATPKAGTAETIFNAALAFSAAERPAYLAGACGDNRVLRQRVEALLRAHEAPHGFLPEQPIAAPRSTILVTPLSEAAGTMIGRYKLLELIGEGGFGSVWMAEQEAPVRRRVALKVIKPGMDTKQVLARFESERQALAIMDHPGIARVFDGGATETGRPYFVMELVRGVRITDYCDSNKLSMRERLGLFIQVCQAVQHAHQKGIIHRDLKPSNILVTEVDGAPVPKVIDFGVAKATQARLTELTLFTGLHQMIGTPAYMSPEQAGLGALDMDTRSDIYALGVLLYELLTGQTPITKEDFEKAGMDEIFRLIREQDPPKPSTRLSALTREELTNIAARRQAEPFKLNRLFRGDLDWIVMKALEKDRRRRYETANGLTMDIQRHLQNEPVTACPPGNFYRFQKMARRNKLVFGAAAAVALSLILGLGISSFLFIREKEARASEAAMLIREKEAHRQAEDAKQQAQAQATRAEAASLEAKTTLSASEFLQGSRLESEGHPGDALAYLARSISDNPANEAASTRLATLLASQSWMAPTVLLRPADSAQFSPDGKRIVTVAADGTALVWDAQSGQPLTEPLRHGNPLSSAQFTTDGKRIVATAPLSAQVWDVQSGRLLAETGHHRNSLFPSQLSPDGQRIVTASMDNTARVWDAQSGEPLTDPLKHEGMVASARFSPNGEGIVTASWDGTARVWDARSGLPLTGPMKHGSIVNSAQFSPNGKRIVTASSDMTARVWDAQSGQPLTEPMKHGSIVKSAQFSPDGKRIVTASYDGTARVWEAQSGQPLTEPMKHGPTVNSAQFSPDGKRILTASTDGTARVWDAQSGQPLTEPLQHGSEVNSAQFSPDGRRILTSAKDGNARLWDVQNGPPLTESLRHGSQVNSAQFSPDGQRIVTASWDGTARVWDAQTGRPLTEPLQHEHAAPVSSAQFSPDGKLIVTSSFDKTARVWDAQSGLPLTAPLPHGDVVLSARFSPDGKMIVTASQDKTARVWEAQSGQPLTEPLQHDYSVTSAQFSPDGKRIVTVSISGVRIWDAQGDLKKWLSFKSMQRLSEPWKPVDSVTSAQFSPDGKRLVTTSLDGTARVREAQGGALTPPMQHGGNIVSAQFSPDGEQIVTASGTMARVWNARSGQLLTEPLRHGSQVNSAQFSPDGKRIVTVSMDNSARVWDAQTGQPLTDPLKHDGYVNSAQFSPDGKRIVTASSDGAARVWDIAPSSENHPAWLAQLAEAISGQALNKQGVLEPTSLNPADVINKLRQELNHQPDHDDWVVWGRWFLADPATRTISPFSKQTVPEYIEDRIKENTVAALGEAQRLAGGNDPLLQRIAEARGTLEQTTRLNTLNHDADALAAQGRLAEAQRKYAEALELSLKVIGPDQPDTLREMRSLANSYCSVGRGKEAITLLEKACALDPKDTRASLMLATWQTWFDQDADYEATRRRLVQQAEGTDQAGTAERAAKVACLRPSTDAVLMTNALNLARRGVELGNNSPLLRYYQLGLGLAEYRNGQYAAAEQTLTLAEQKFGETRDFQFQETARLFRAMSLFRQNRLEDSRRAFSQAEAAMPPFPQDERKPLVDGKPVSHDVLICWLAYKEAKSVLNEPAAAKP
jgi:WD40 repeat protein/tetratricopeptide (TPR) repeat protein/tRNA A-37 threonylcarbamoyl transferase component Bud32